MSFLHSWPRLRVCIPTIRFLQARTTTRVPTKVTGLAFFRGAVNVRPFAERERAHIESQLRFQNAYDSVDIISDGNPVEGGIDLNKAPVLAGAICETTGLVGVPPDRVHMTRGRAARCTHPTRTR